MAKAKLDKKAQQFFAIMTNVKSVGVKNGARTFGYVIGIRAISTSQATYRRRLLSISFLVIDVGKVYPKLMLLMFR